MVNNPDWLIIPIANWNGEYWDPFTAAVASRSSVKVIKRCILVYRLQKP